MKKVAFAFALVAIVASPVMAQSSHPVRGYTKNNGTYVAPHMQTNPNTTKMDNWSTKGNVNPYNNKVGTVDPYKAPSTPK